MGPLQTTFFISIDDDGGFRESPREIEFAPLRIIKENIFCLIALLHISFNNNPNDTTRVSFVMKISANNGNSSGDLCTGPVQIFFDKIGYLVKRPRLINPRWDIYGLI